MTNCVNQWFLLY
ncbi:hypothetical protein Patl1_18314 [Pistacia atlantica]|uniref:Uncharacterized protein n=1 Tax=Pistacia atlantica TaxID=434234 RepID=A0ACC1C156_9ROSI|nr:hypothetical protein Patl1_18314 [Pistacia atlantica]